MKTDRRQQIARLLEAALARDAGQRLVFLAEACAGDDMLRQEVELLLRHHDDASGFMERPALQMTAKTVAADGGETLVGRQLAQYRILEKIGAGGMGEVYRARDTRLGRDVAIKILPTVLVSDSDRRARFEREARLLAALNHPHIGAIYGLEDLAGIPALVLELVEGPTLAERVAKGPLPVPEAVSLAAQIAHALEAAHEKGIVHRDLKPANIKIRPDGTVKVLDFGLAKTIIADAEGVDLTQGPTMIDDRTRDGMVVGTPAYMSPEQARGKPLDKRTDIWAFGCVLYEMLTGSRAFGGGRAADTLVSVMSEQPAWHLLPADTPAAVRRVVRRCLVKDPQARLRDLGDAQMDLREALTEPAIDDTPPPFTSHARRRRRVVTWAAVIVLTGFASGVTVWNVMRNPEAPRAAERLAITVPAVAQAMRTGSQAVLTAVRGLAISPDGRSVVYVGPAESLSASRLYVRSLDAYEPRPLEGTEGASAPFFSPDGQAVAFFAAGKLKRTSVAGGATATISDAPDDTSGGSGGTWGPDDTIVFAVPTSARAGLYRVSAYGGAPEVLTTQDPADEGGLGDPAFIPGTASVMFTTRLTKAGISSSIVVRSLTTGLQHKLALGGSPGSAGTPASPSLSRPQYTLTGHLVYTRGSTIMAAAFRPDTGQITGPVVPIVEEVADFRVFSRWTARVRQGAVVRRPAGLGRSAWIDRADRGTGPKVRTTASVAQRYPACCGSASGGSK